MKPKYPKHQVDTLRGLGLSRIQALLYLTSLKHGVLSVLELSKRTDINRQQIYEEAEKLVTLGLYDITRRERRKYIPAMPQKLVSIGEEQRETANKLVTALQVLLPSLESCVAPKKQKVVVKYYDGIRRIREGYENELAASRNTEVLTLVGSIEDTFAFFPESYWDKWNKRFVRSGSRSRMIVHNSKIARDTARHDHEYRRETRYLERFPLKANIDVFGNTVFIVSPYDEIGIWIESATLAGSYRILFDALWAFARPFS